MSGKEFKSLLISRGLTQKSVAHSIGVSPQTLSSFLNGNLKELKKSKYYRLCNELGIEVLF
jgi:transcriptional regulator with XRE-family HTH domain